MSEPMARFYALTLRNADGSTARDVAKSTVTLRTVHR
jgi:hypothetical protein